VEGYRQKSPKNAAKITRILLEAGADVDAEADVYGGGATTLGLVATSTPPEQAGVQIDVLKVLLEYDAEIDHRTSAGNQQDAVTGCLANGQGDAAVFLAEHGARLNLESAAGVGRLDVVESYFHDDGSLKPSATDKQLKAGFIWACGYGRMNVVRFFVERNVDLTVHGGDGQTGLHMAAIGGQLEVMKLLLTRDPPLENRNVYGGTVLGQTLWSAAHGGDPKLYATIVEALIAAGAKVPERHPPINRTVDAVLRKYGSVADRTRFWFGEKPRKPAARSR
jgi:ankyrin repeat protein